MGPLFQAEFTPKLKPRVRIRYCSEGKSGKKKATHVKNLPEQ